MTDFIDIEQDLIEKLKARLQELERELVPYFKELTPEELRKTLEAQRKLGLRRCR